MLEIIEKTLTDLLNKKFEGFEVDSFPTKFEEWDFTSHNGCLLIRYEGSDFSGQNTLLAVNQSETYSYSIIAGFRFCNSHKDCHKWVKQLRKTVLGYTINGYRVVLKRIRFLEEIDTDLWWGISFSVVQEAEDTNKDFSWWNAVYK